MRELELIYRKHKKQLLPLIFGFVSVFVFFRIIMPQWSDIRDVQQLLTTKSDTVNAKDATVTLLNSLPQEEVDNNYTLVTTALPLQKDVVLIFSELNDAANKADVKLGGFTVKVGGIYSTSKNIAQSTDKSINGIPYLRILINISGKNDNLRKFADVLYRSIPIVEIKNVDITKNDARYDVNFYFKPIALKAPSADSTTLTNLTSLEASQLKELKSWQQVVNPSPSSSQ